MNKGFIIAIDGPVAAGKGTIAPELATKLGGFYLYTGASYRSVALYGIEHGIDFSDQQAIIGILPNVTLDLRDHKVFLNGQDVTEEIKRVDVARMTPTVAAIAQVRQSSVKRQQEIAHEQIAKGHIIVIEGRDTATVVFPDAALKIFLTAQPEVRAQRRLEQLETSGSKEATFASVLEDLHRRDREDTQRVADPLVSHPELHGYFVVDNSTSTEEETVGSIIVELKKRNLL